MTDRRPLELSFTIGLQESGCTPSGDNRVHLRILDLDGSVAAQASLGDAAPWSTVQAVAMRDLAQPLRLWARAATMRNAAARLGAPPGGPATVTMIGSGDYHHLAAPLMAQAREPVTVVHFDNHPDWVRWAPRWHCGSWVNQVLKLPQVARVVTLGPCSDDLVRPGLKGGNLGALDAGRIALFPWRHAPSRVFHRIADGPGHRHANGHIVWRNLADSNTRRNLDLILPAIETAAIWLTIDKDVLAEDQALTNWDQGQMPLQAMLDLIRGIAAAKRIAGADICGEYSPPRFANPLKRIESRIDRPQRAASDAALARNEAVNRQLLATICEAAAC
jgi:arginase family enzyme